MATEAKQSGLNLADIGLQAMLLFGGMGLMLLFVLAQGVYMSRHLPKEGN